MSHPINPELIQQALLNLQKTAFVPMQDPMMAAMGGAAGGAPPGPAPAGAPGAPPGMPMDPMMMGGGMPMGLPPDMMNMLNPPAPGMGAPPAEQGQEAGSKESKGESAGGLTKEDIQSLVQTTVREAIDDPIGDLTAIVRDLKEEIADLKSQINAILGGNQSGLQRERI